MLQAIKNKKIILAVAGVIVIVAVMAAGMYWWKGNRNVPYKDPLSGKRVFDAKTVLEQAQGSAEMRKLVEELEKNKISPDTFVEYAARFPGDVFGDVMDGRAQPEKASGSGVSPDDFVKQNQGLENINSGGQFPRELPYDVVIYSDNSF